MFSLTYNPKTSKMAPPAQSNGHSGTNGHANGHSNGNASAAPMSDSKLGNGWLPPTNRTNHPEITTNSGMGYANPSHSLSLGPRGATTACMERFVAMLKVFWPGLQAHPHHRNLILDRV